MGFSEQPASPTAVHLPPVGGLAEPRLAGSGRTPDPLYWRKEKQRGHAPQNDIDDISDIIIDMGAAVESVVIDVIVVTEAGGVSNETLAYQNRHLEYDIAYAPPCDIVQTYKIRQRLLTIEHKFDIM